MSIRKKTITQTPTGVWAADSVISTDLDEVGLITRMDCTVEITPSATLTGANQPDGLFRVLGNLKILGGSHQYINLPSIDGGQGGTLLHYLNKMDGHGIGHADGAVAAPVQATTQINFVIHPGSRPRDWYGRDDPFDLSAFIPAGPESQLRAEWTTFGNDVMDDSVSISSAVMRYTLHRVQGELDEIQQEMQAQGVNLPPGANGMVPAWSAIVHANAGTTSDFDAEQVEIVVGAYLKRIALLCQDATATRPLRAGDEVTRMAIKVPKTSEDLYNAFSDYLTSHMEYGTNLTANSGALESGGTEKMQPDFNAAAPQGVYVIDLRARAKSYDGGLGRDYGLDLRREQNGTYKLGLYITARAAGDDSLVLFERYQTYVGDLVAGK